MSESRQQEAQEESRTPEGPGRRLREAREARGLSREEVATELRLNLKLVRALEEDDYEHLPPAAFVTGYLRNYARLLDLPEQEIVESFERAGGEPPELVSYGRDTQVRSSDLPVRLVTYLLVIGLAVLLAVWWFSEGQQKSAPLTEAPETEIAPGEAPSLGEETLETPVEPGPPMGEVPTEEPATEAPSAQPLPGEPTSQEPAEPESLTEEPAPPQAVEETAPPEPAPPAVAREGGVELRLVFSADSWAEVTDAAGRSLVYDLIQQGRELTLEGQPPFRVFLGYAPGVTLYYRGEQFEHAAFIRRNETARFRVGREDDSPRSEAE